MSTQENKDIVHRMFDQALNKGNTSLINGVFAPGYVDHSPLPAPVPGPEDFAKRLVALRGGFVEEASQYRSECFNPNSGAQENLTP